MHKRASRRTCDSWRSLQNQPIDELLGVRYERLMGYGKFKEVAEK